MFNMQNLDNLRLLLKTSTHRKRDKHTRTLPILCAKPSLAYIHTLSHNLPILCVKPFGLLAIIQQKIHNLLHDVKLCDSQKLRKCPTQNTHNV